MGIYHFFFPNLTLHILNDFPILSLLYQESFSYQLTVRQKHFVYNYLCLPEIRAVLVLQYKIGLDCLQYLATVFPGARQRILKEI